MQQELIQVLGGPCLSWVINLGCLFTFLYHLLIRVVLRLDGITSMIYRELTFLQKFRSTRSKRWRISGRRWTTSIHLRDSTLAATTPCSKRESSQCGRIRWIRVEAAGLSTLIPKTRICEAATRTESGIFKRYSKCCYFSPSQTPVANFKSRNLRA